MTERPASSIQLNLITTPPAEERSIVMSMFACACLFVNMSLQTETLHHILCVPCGRGAVARSFSGSVAINRALPVF